MEGLCGVPSHEADHRASSELDSNDPRAVDEPSLPPTAQPAPPSSNPALPSSLAASQPAAMSTQPLLQRTAAKRIALPVRQEPKVRPATSLLPL
jgi:hypothetical protein